MMNNKGSLGLAIIFAITIFIVGVTTINLVTPEVTNARSATGLNCINISNISDGAKLTCLAVDWVVPYWFIIILSLSGGYILSKLNI